MLKKVVKATRGRPKKRKGDSHRWDNIGGVDGYLNGVMMAMKRWKRKVVVQ